MSVMLQVGSIPAAQEIDLLFGGGGLLNRLQQSLKYKGLARQLFYEG